MQITTDLVVAWSTIGANVTVIVGGIYAGRAALGELTKIREANQATANAARVSADAAVATSEYQRHAETRAQELDPEEQPRRAFQSYLDRMVYLEQRLADGEPLVQPGAARFWERTAFSLATVLEFASNRGEASLKYWSDQVRFEMEKHPELVAHGKRWDSNFPQFREIRTDLASKA